MKSTKNVNGENIILETYSGVWRDLVQEDVGVGACSPDVDVTSGDTSSRHVSAIN
jgi:hypothetical protein